MRGWAYHDRTTSCYQSSTQLLFFKHIQVDAHGVTTKTVTPGRGAPRNGFVVT